jgi:hypothetical protein
VNLEEYTSLKGRLLVSRSFFTELAPDCEVVCPVAEDIIDKDFCRKCKSFSVASCIAYRF